MSFAKSFERYVSGQSVRKSISVSTKLEKIFQDEEAAVVRFLRQQDVPAWFRGMSAFQMQAANDLQFALRDDSEQETTHRVRACLTVIGLKPMVNAHGTKLLMRLCRGNDLAFLWFLLELKYKTPSKTQFTINEQLIMSSIAHLDMISTLRELDRILPPGSLSKKSYDRQKRLTELQQKIAPTRKRSKCNIQHAKATFPYFQTMRRAQAYGKSLNITEPGFSVKFGPYAAYNNENYVVNNENSRWYVNYELQPQRRIVNRIIKEEINKIFDDFSAALEKASMFPSLCAHHEQEMESRELARLQRLLDARDRCLENLDVFKYKNKLRRQRVLNDLERLINYYQCKWHKKSRPKSKRIVMHLLTGESDCKTFIETPEECPKCPYGGNGTFGDHAKEREFVTARRGSIAEQPTKVLLIDRKMYSHDEHDIQVVDRIYEGDGDDGIRPKARVSIGNTYMENLDYSAYDNHGDLLSPHSSQIFFTAPRESQSYKFDYYKIFNFKQKSSENDHRQTDMLQAVESNADVWRKEKTAQTKLIAAVKSCAKKIWQKQVAIKNRQLKEEELKRKNEEKSPLNFKLDYYDPMDKKLMENMLQEALAYMSHNPKFVLAAMPESYKVPVLREWICQRYGKTYTKMERTKEFRLSQKIFRALDKVTMQVPMPGTRELGAELFVNYSCRDYVLKKADHIKQRYYKRLDNMIMDQARVFWFAISPYLCSNGPPRNTYFAYMPSRVADIHHFRIWKASEFMNAKSEWDRRWREKVHKMVAGLS